MITEWLISLGVMVGDWFVSLFPEWDVPAEIASFDDTLSGFMGGFSSLGAWVPWGVLITCALIAVGGWAIGWGVKAIRAVAAHIPFVGGAG